MSFASDSLNFYNNYNTTNAENYENRTECANFFNGNLTEIKKSIQSLNMNKSEDYDQRRMELIEEMKETVKIGEKCFNRERRFKSGDTEEWKWSSYFSFLHILLPVVIAIVVCPIMVKNQDDDDGMGFLHIRCLPIVPLTKIFSAVVEVKSHFNSFKYRGGPKFYGKASKVAEWTKIIANIGML